MSKANAITLDDLTAVQKLLVRVVGDEPQEKRIDLELNECNYMAAIGIMAYAGGGKYELTALGKELYKESVYRMKNEILSEEMKEYAQESNTILIN